MQRLQLTQAPARCPAHFFFHSTWEKGFLEQPCSTD